MPRTTVESPYMQFAKLESHATYGIGSSGVAALPIEELGATFGDIKLAFDGPYGYPPLLERIARYCSVPVGCVVTAEGCSMANHLAMAATVEPGDGVLIEEPTYELLLSALRYFGAEIKRFSRREENNYALDLNEVRDRLTARTSLIVLCNLHNPTSAMVDEATLRELGAMARAVDAKVLVDEVYLECVWPRPRTALALGDEFIVTSSLTKGYGLPGLRCGWILAEPALAERIWRLNDVFGGAEPVPSQSLSVVAFDNLERISARARGILEANRPVVRAFIESRTELECYLPEQGTTVFPKLKRGSVDELSHVLKEQYDTTIVPGKYFERPQHFRLGLGGDPEMTRQGLERLGKALDQM